MSRPFRFRAWSTSSKQIYPFTLDDCYQEGYDDGWDEAEGADVGSRLSYTAPDMVVMQYSGLKDKHGREIYQGDILKLNNDTYDPDYQGFYVGLVEVTAKTCGFGLKPLPALQEPNHYDSSMFWHVGEENTTEVIGNIYENPELLNE